MMFEKGGYTDKKPDGPAGRVDGLRACKFYKGERCPRGGCHFNDGCARLTKQAETESFGVWFVKLLSPIVKWAFVRLMRIGVYAGILWMVSRVFGPLATYEPILLTEATVTDLATAMIAPIVIGIIFWDIVKD